MTDAPFYSWYFICTGRELLAETSAESVHPCPTHSKIC